MRLQPPSAPDFSDPLGLLAACHQRMRDFCDLLGRIDDYLQAHAPDADVVDSSRRVRHYFNSAARLHHADEEHDLFPLLATDHGLTSLIARLGAEHATLDAAWRRLDMQLQHLCAGRPDLAGLHVAQRDFCAACRHHIALEDRALLPVAAARLGADQLRQLGQAMARRRGVDPVAKTQ